ncbi:uncharacterized protein LOC133758444 isoform X2 [Lepus europaeus]|uniref:uncharacterized protein LOC133758444 isoform X2 n=1 Tax=Lepus europaeus TaxID=9983 RepID=UPI002B459289|nr:uncharacterized protein LOC133758444 isoform X2 [Lepus europaeus]
MDGKRRAGATVVSITTTIWSASLPEGTSAQKAELLVLTKALELATGKRATIYTDSRYAFATAHVHGAIYQQRGLLTSAGKEIKHKAEILRLLAAVSLPSKLAIVHCPSHQKGSDPITVGNQRADEEAKAAALWEPEVCTLAAESETHAPPEHREETLEQRAVPYLQQVQRFTHLGARKLQILLGDQPFSLSPSDNKHLVKQVANECKACQAVNAYPIQTPEGKRLQGDRPGQFWEVDFTEVRTAKYGYKYLLVFVDTFSGWVEAFPTHKETALVVAKKILEEIFPLFGLPQVIGSDSSPAFVAQIKGIGRGPKAHLVATVC